MGTPSMVASPRIAFVANHYLTETMFAVAELLESRHGCEIHWFAVSRRWARWLVRQGVDPSRIVCLFRAPRQALAPDLAALNRDDEPGVDYLIQMDRVLSLRPERRVRRELGDIIHLFRAELAERHIDLIFGEATWTVEVLMSYAARQFGVGYLAPISVRIPQNRIGFAPAPLQRELIELRAQPRSGDPEPESMYEDFLGRRAGGLWAHNNFSVSRYLRQPFLLAEKLWLAFTDSRKNPTQDTLVSYMRRKNPVGLALNARRLRAFMKVHAYSDPGDLDRPYVLVSLHLQPEASVDIVAWQASDQFDNVRRIAQNLPDGMVVAVKEHSHQFGSRSTTFFESMRSLPNVVFVDPFVSSRVWTESARAVISPSGTMVLENALEGRRSVLLAPMWFGGHPAISTITREEFSRLPAIAQDERAIDADAGARQHFGMVLRRSHEGQFAAGRNIPGAVAPENIENLAAAFYEAALCSGVATTHSGDARDD